MKKDMVAARESNINAAMLDRLLLTSERLKAIADDVRQVCHLEDPVGQVIDGRLLDSGLRLGTPPSPFRGCWRYFFTKLVQM